MSGERITQRTAAALRAFQAATRRDRDAKHEARASRHAREKAAAELMVALHTEDQRRAEAARRKAAR